MKSSSNYFKSAFKITALYAVISVLWIFLSDVAVVTFFSDVKVQRQLNLYKGWIFVLLTAILLFVLIRNLLAREQAAFTARMELQKRWQFSMELAGNAIWDWKLGSGERHYYGGWAGIIEEDAQHFEQQEPWFSYMATEDQARVQSEIEAHLARKTDRFESEHRIICKNGRIKWLLARGLATETDAAGNVLRFSGVVTDITRQKALESELRIAATTFESNEARIITDSDKNIVRVNQAFTDITGYSQDEVIGRNPSFLRSELQSADFYKQMWRDIKNKGNWQGEIWNKRKNGEFYPERLRINVVRDSSGHISHYIGSFNDSSELKEAQEAVYNLSYYDALTRLPNKHLLTRKIEQSASAENRDTYSALILLDVKNFKALNNTVGHAAGDSLLVTIGNRLVQSVQGNSTVARYGSDVFAVLLETSNRDENEALSFVHSMAEMMADSVSEPVEFDEISYQADIRLGIRLYKPGKDAFEAVLKQAEVALHTAKSSWGAPVYFYSESMQQKVQSQFYMESNLRAAIPHDLFILYQAQVDDAGFAIGAELLIRWQDAEAGVISPAEFIPVAERSGLIKPIGKWVLESACDKLAQWADQPNLNALTLSVNVSVHQFMDDSFINELKSVVKHSGIDPTKLKLELTESIFAEQIDTIIAKMNQIKALGIRMSLDDFGTGFSSLSYVKRLPLDQLKIDQAFVREIDQQTQDSAIVKSIITLGDSLGMSVIAEGVERASQKAVLTQLGCRRFQGYLFSKPIAVEQFEQIVKNNNGQFSFHVQD